MKQRELIDKIYKEQKLTQTELAAKVDRSYPTITKWRGGSVKIDPAVLTLMKERGWVSEDDIMNLE